MATRLEISRRGSDGNYCFMQNGAFDLVYNQNMQFAGNNSNAFLVEKDYSSLAMREECLGEITHLPDAKWQANKGDVKSDDVWQTVGTYDTFDEAASALWEDVTGERINPDDIKKMRERYYETCNERVFVAISQVSSDGVPTSYQANKFAETLQYYQNAIKFAQPKKDGLTALHVAAQKGIGLFCDKLIQNGADAKLKDASGNTAFDMAPNDDIKLSILVSYLKNTNNPEPIGDIQEMKRLGVDFRQFTFVYMDTTDNWRDDIASKAGRVYEGKVFDENVVTFCASTQPSYEVYSTSVYETQNYYDNEAEREQLDCDIRDGMSNNYVSDYYDVTTVSKISESSKNKSGWYVFADSAILGETLANEIGRGMNLTAQSWVFDSSKESLEDTQEYRSAIEHAIDNWQSNPPMLDVNMSVDTIASQSGGGNIDDALKEMSKKSSLNLK